MEWLGTGFTLTIGGLRLRVRIALEDAPLAQPAWHHPDVPPPQTTKPAVEPPASRAHVRWN